MTGLATLPDSPRSRPRRLRRYFLLAACVVFILIATPIAFYLWASSAGTQELVRRRMIAALEQTTGGRVQIATFRWNLLNLQADAGGLVIHGREAPGEAPLASVQRMTTSVTLLGLWSPRILLRNLQIVHPVLHIIVFPDGTTNLPQPPKPQPHVDGMQTLFNLQAKHISLAQGELDFDNRAAEFDFQDRFTLLDFDAQDVSLLMRYIPAQGSVAETYRVEAGAGELSLVRGKEKPALASMQATLDLTRTAANLRSLRVTTDFPSKARGMESHSMEVSGVLNDFSHPHWQATIEGELDMRLLEPSLGFPFAPAGIAHLDLESAGDAEEFRIDGSVHAVDASYIGTGVVAKGLQLDAHVHADPRQLLISKAVARLAQGGQVSGQLALTPWLPHSNKTPAFARMGINSVHAAGSRATQQPMRHTPPDPNVITVPVNGKVTAEFKDVSLDTLMDLVGQPPFQRLGLDTRINGVTHAEWVKGDQQTVVAAAQLELTPSSIPVRGEVPVTGSIDATYRQADGAVDMRTLTLNSPASQVSAHGHLGAYPLTSASSFNVDFHSHNLSEFDTVLRDLGLNRNGRSGVAALPVILSGQMDFLHGSWTGSLLNPHLAGSARATQLAIEMPIQAGASAGQPGKPVSFDSVEATGSYAAERLAIESSLLRRGKTEVALNGTLDAVPGRQPTFDENSVLHAHLRAANVGLDDVQALAGRNLNATGTLSTQLQLDGTLRSLGGAGWAQLEDGSVYGEPVTRIRAQGAMSNDLVKLPSVAAVGPPGSISASGTYDLKSQRFQIDARATEIDVARIATLRRSDPGAGGNLAFTIAGSGTVDDPRLEVHATLSGLKLGGESLGALAFTGHTANRLATYSATTKLAGAEIDLAGQTALSGDYTTKAKLDFAHFDIGGLLSAAHIGGLTGESALAGMVTIEGPLAHPVEMHGDARLQQLAASIAGVHLASQGGFHATLANGRVTLDPLHVTGEDTDLRAQGSFSLKDTQKLDFSASGSVNLKLAETVDRDLTVGGTTTFQVEAHGTLKDPGLKGRIAFENGSLSLEDVTIGLSQLHGLLEFNQNRLEVTSLTAMSGGGLLSVGGYLAYQHGVYADLAVTGKGVRIRYPQGVSSLGDLTLRLQGTQNNLLLSGDVMITRFSVNSDLDIGALAAQANTVQTIAPPDAPSNHIRYDVHIASSPQLNFQNAYAKLAGNVDLHLRGTVASPSLLGRVSITEGNAIIAGTRYDLQRGDIFFTNPVRIEPNIDLNATARVEDYDITLGLHGTPQKLAVTYRSDPPLPEADVVALLALGRTENQQRLYTQQQEQSVANPTTDALLGGALNATVSSRVQRLFGAGSVKVDPNYIGVLGNSTSRITVEEQLGRNITLTYATDVDTTGQQLLQAEIAINRHVSVLVARDESGVFSMVIKATRRYR
jgi:translocation and assembly module TamB